MSLVRTIGSTETAVSYDAHVARNYDLSAWMSFYKAPSVLLKAIGNHVRPGMQILEGGVGTGLLARRLHRAGMNVCGMDVSPDMLERCWSRRIWNRPLRSNIKSFGFLGLFKRENICEELVRIDMERERWPFRSGCMDGVVVCGSMEWIDHPRNMINEASRTLKDGGFFGITFVPQQDGENIAGRHPHASILDLMQKAGMTIVHDRPFTENFANSGPNTMAPHRVVVGVKTSRPEP